MLRTCLKIFALTLLLWGCGKKKYPPALLTENEPVFSFRGNINGTPVEIKAGINDYRVFPNLTQDNYGVYGYIAELRPTSCAGNCPGSLFLQINDRQISAIGGTNNISAALAPGNYDLMRDTSGHSYKVKFTPSFNKTAASYLWDFGDGGSSTEAQPTHVYSQPGKYQVCLTITASNSCQSSICNILQLGNGINGAINANNLNANAIWFQPEVTGGNGNYTYRWDFGDGNKSQLASPTHTYAIPGSYPVRLRVSWPGNDSIEIKYNAVTNSDISSCAANFKAQVVESSPNGMALSKASIRWIDGNGRLFTSVNLSQPVSSALEILSIEDYPGEENGYRLKKVKLKFNCTLYYGNETLQLSNGEAVLATAYK